MKIALCLHGYFNSKVDRLSLGKDGYQHILKNIYHKITDIDSIDTYIHSWDTDIAKYIYDLYSPISFCFERQVDFEPIVKERGLEVLNKTGAPRPPATILSHFYSLQKSMQLCYRQGIKYDIVIKSRFDLGRINRNPNRTPVQCINFDPAHVEEGRICMADWELFSQGPADMWFYGDINAMSYFCYIYDDLLKVFKLGSDFHIFASGIQGRYGDLSNAVIFLHWWMKKYDLWNNRKGLKCTYE